MPKFLHIYINPKKGVEQEDIESKLNLALDWYRYDEKSYLIYSTSDVKRWHNRLIDFVKNGGQLFIVELEIKKRSGWFNKALWKWIQEKERKTT